MIKEHNAKVETLSESFSRMSTNKPLVAAKQENAKKWLNQRKMNTSKRIKARNQLFSDRALREDGRLVFGNIYMYAYDAKTKDRMAYWDYFPMVLPYAYTATGFYGMNLHYLPPKIRAYVLDLIRVTKKGKELVPTASVVQQLAKLPEFLPSIHQYSYTQIRSSVAKIEVAEWENVIFLPLQDFRSAHGGSPTQNKVYADYRRKL